MKRITIVILLLLTIIPIGCTNNQSHNEQVNTQTVAHTDWQPDMVIEGVNIFGVAPDGFNAMFITEKRYDYLIVMWTVYPSDMFMGQMVRTTDGRYHSFSINTYPEGGTVMWRIEVGDENLFSEDGTEWFFQDLPRPEGGTVLPPPYLTK